MEAPNFTRTLIVPCLPSGLRPVPRSRGCIWRIQSQMPGVARDQTPGCARGPTLLAISARVGKVFRS
jgi:hypothetical protein